jgi:hypothetical protein
MKARGQGSERTVVGFTQCKNVDKRVIEVSYDDGTGASWWTSYRIYAESIDYGDASICDAGRDGNRQTIGIYEADCCLTKRGISMRPFLRANLQRLMEGHYL